MTGKDGGARKGRKKGRHPQNALSAAFVRTVAKPGRYCDGNGLYLHVDPSGARRWVQRLVVRGRSRTLGLGGCSLVSLAQARARALDNRRLARAGGDPLARKRAAGVPSFAEAAATVHALHRPSWRSAKHAGQWLATLRRHAFPRLGKRAVSDIAAADVMAALTPIWHERPATARRVRQRIGKVMQWAIAQGWRADNPAGEAIGAALPRNGVRARHYPALPHAETPAAVAAVRACGASAAIRLALEFLILTAARSGEGRAAEWREMDMERAVWTIPAERMKGKRAHRVPLSRRALAILSEARALDDGGGLVFPGARRGRPMSDTTLSKPLRILRLDAVAHGFRSTFRDWAAERTDAPRAVMEAALAHAVRDRVEAAYARTDLFERRRALMERWADYLEAPADPCRGSDGLRRERT